MENFSTLRGAMPQDVQDRIAKRVDEGVAEYRNIHRHGHFPHEEIADLAYTIWQLSGEPQGEALANWYEAERILQSPLTESTCEDQNPQ